MRGKRLKRKVLEREQEDNSRAGRERDKEGKKMGAQKRPNEQERQRGRAVRFLLRWLESDRGANRVASDDSPTGECRLCQWSGTNGAREGMQLPAPEGGYCATGQGGLTWSQDGGLEGREGDTQGRESQPC